MITLYHCSDARSFRALWTLEEMRLPYRLELMPFPPRERRPDFLEINALGTIPVLIDGDTLMTESAAICQYLVTRHGPSDLDVPVGDPSYGAFLNWLHFGEATLTFPQTLVLRYGRLEPEERRIPQVVEDYGRWFAARLRAVDAAVSRSDYLCADRFTVADISVGYALLLANNLGLHARFKEATAAYWERLRSREGFARAKQAQSVRQPD